MIGDIIMNKKLLSMALATTVALTVGCTPTPTPKAESQTYTAYGRYYTDGTVITNDGNEWAYSTDTIPTDAMPVWVGFDDNGTPDDIYDDIILGVVYDRNTAIYDSLEDVLSDEFELEREGNYIRIITNVESTDNGTLYTFDDETGYYAEN